MTGYNGNMSNEPDAFVKNQVTSSPLSYILNWTTLFIDDVNIVDAVYFIDLI